jgi:glycosyltransferase involved in cell wall biosynthesis
MKIILMTDMPPCSGYPTGLMLDQLCRFLPKGSIACYAVVNPHLEDARISRDLDWIPIQYREKPNEMAASTPLGVFENAYAFVKESYRAFLNTTKIAADAVKFARQFDPDLLWCVLEGQTMIRLALPVSGRLGITLLSQLYDLPNWWLHQHNLDRLSRTTVLRKFEQVLRRSARCAVASWALAERYEQDYGKRTVPLLPSLDSRLALPPARQVHSGNEFVIGIAGQIYATDAWSSLVRALDSARWELCGRRVKVRLLGRYAHLAADAKMNIEFLGWHSQEETIRLLSETDMLYCPYWFSSAFETEARLTFPSKLTTYFASGRPVFFHGPTYASPVRFLTENDAGLRCHSLEPSEILSRLAELVSNPDLYSSLTSNGKKAFERHLTLSSMRRSLAEFLNVEEDWLLPIRQSPTTD